MCRITVNMQRHDINECAAFAEQLTNCQLLFLLCTTTDRKPERASTQKLTLVHFVPRDSAGASGGGGGRTPALPQEKLSPLLDSGAGTAS